MVPLALRPEFEAWMAQVREKPLWGLLLGLGDDAGGAEQLGYHRRAAGRGTAGRAAGVHSLLGLAGAVPVLLGQNTSARPLRRF